MGLSGLIPLLEDEISDPDQETFELFARDLPGQDLGFVDRAAAEVAVTVRGREYAVRQSPGVLGSDRAGGTTGAVLWRIAPLFADHISDPSSPLSAALFPSPLDDDDHDNDDGDGDDGRRRRRGPVSVLELGCGISPLTALALRGRTSSYVLTDQAYVQKLVQENIAANTSSSSPVTKGGGGKNSKKSTRKSSSKSAAGEGGGTGAGGAGREGTIRFATLDWETDVPTPEAHGTPDVVLATDCVYNYALVRPLVQTCAETCRLRRRATSFTTSTTTTTTITATTTTTAQEGGGEGDLDDECVCLVAQQLRSHDVFAEWLAEFHRSFRVWRVPDGMMSPGLRAGAGFVAHLGVLRR
ncbi:hypothetical protein N3K66_008032 [Trichothecium roseum]|uniref:Uncharacterized protein n=1 Tax=Trichothecium roseum TaxID=47278 RepID=A0ACC0USF8_9HYPO|nr:hypothetical protein N3K66_008032 [Trichothecium roseum]